MKKALVIGATMTGIALLLLVRSHAQQRVGQISVGGTPRITAADAARLFKVHPATVSRLLARAYAK